MSVLFVLVRRDFFGASNPQGVFSYRVEVLGVIVDVVSAVPQVLCIVALGCYQVFEGFNVVALWRQVGDGDACLVDL